MTRKSGQRLLASLLTLALLFSTVGTTAFAAEPLQESEPSSASVYGEASPSGNALLTQLFRSTEIQQKFNLNSSNVRTSLGYFYIPVDSEQLTENYAVDFDYYVPSRPAGQNLEQTNFLVWSSMSGIEIRESTNPTVKTAVAAGPAVIQNGQKLELATVTAPSNDGNGNVSISGSRQTLTENLADDQWHHIRVEYAVAEPPADTPSITTSTSVTVVINGQASEPFQVAGGVKLQNLGPCGDISWEDSIRGAGKATGYAYYDNMVLSADGNEIAANSFDGNSAEIKAGSMSANSTPSYFGVSQTVLVDKPWYVPVSKIGAPELGALQTGTKTSLSGFFGRAAADVISADSYAYSFDYYVPADSNMKDASELGDASRSGQRYIVCQFSSASVANQCRVVQHGNRLYLMDIGSDAVQADKEYTITSSLSRDEWHNLTLSFSGKRVGVYLDGQLVSLTGAQTENGYLLRSNEDKLVKFGLAGDLSGYNSQGYAFYDNVMLTAGNQSVFFEDFNKASLGQVSGFTFDGNPNTYPLIRYEMDQPATLNPDSVSALPNKEEYKVGAVLSLPDLLAMSGKMTDGRSAIMDLAQVEVTSSGSNYKLTDDGNLMFTESGEIPVDFAISFPNSETVNKTLTFHVTGEVVVEELSIDHRNPVLLLGLDAGGVELKTSVKLAGDTGFRPADKAAFSLLAALSGDTSILTVSEKDGKFYLTPVKAGVSTVTVSYANPLGATVTAAKAFTVRETGGSALLTQQSDLAIAKTELGIAAGSKVCPAFGYFYAPVKNAASLPEDYVVSFDYYAPSRYALNNFIVWSSMNGLQYTDAAAIKGGTPQGPVIYQTGQNVSIGRMSFDKTSPDRYVSFADSKLLTSGLALDQWHRFTLHYKGSTLGVYIDGKLASNGYYDMGQMVKIETLGPCGDITWTDTTKGSNASQGYAYYDNLQLTSPSVNQSLDFNAPSADMATTWGIANDDGSYFIPGNKHSTQAVYDLRMDQTPPAAGQVSAAAIQSAAQIGRAMPAAELIQVNAFWDDGSPAPVDPGRITYASSDSNIIEVVSGANGLPVLSFKAAGTAEITVSVTPLGGTVSQEAKVKLWAVTEAVVARLDIVSPAAELIVGDSLEIGVKATNSDGTIVTLSGTGLAGYAITSSDPSILKAEGTKLTALKKGSADITVARTFENGMKVTTSKAVTCLDVVSIRLDALTSNAYIGDKVALKVTGLFEDGRAVDISGVAVLTANSGEVPADAQGLRLYSCAAAGTVKLEAEYRGLKAAASLVVKELKPVKAKSSYYTSEKVANARQNANATSWAENLRTQATNKADKWLENYTLEDLWLAVPSQEVPRCYNVVVGGECLFCGKALSAQKYGNYPYLFNDSSIDWKLTCPSCTGVFPTNDFKAYYEGGLDASGRFDPELAAASNKERVAAGGTGGLVNRYYQNLPAELEKNIRDAMKNAGYSDAVIDARIGQIQSDPGFGVDDGMGYRLDMNNKETLGNPYTYVGYYTHWAFWHESKAILQRMLKDFSDAYLYSGIQKYADAAIVLLDRIADLYPEMQVSAFPQGSPRGSNGSYGFANSDGHVWSAESRGRLVGSIWESADVKSILLAYDAVYPAIDSLGADAKAVLNTRAHFDGKSASDRIKVNFEDGLVREVRRAFSEDDLVGNPGMAQSALALAAVVLDHYPETQEWLDLVFEAGYSEWKEAPSLKRTGNTLNVLLDQVDPDGQGDEGALGYNALWIGNWITVAQALDGYRLPKDENGGEHPLASGDPDLFHNARFLKMIKANYPLLLTYNYTPNIGDTGSTAAASWEIINTNALITAYAKAPDTEIAQALYLLNGKSEAGLHYDIFTANPDALSDEVAATIRDRGELTLDSALISAYNLGILRDGVEADSKVDRGTEYFFPALQKERAPGLGINTAYSNLDQVEPSAVGQWIEYSFDFSSNAAEAYQLYLKLHAVKGGWGKWAIHLNGVSVGVVDFAAYESGQSLVAVKAGLALKSGTNKLRFVCQGGGNLKMGLYSLYFLADGKQMPPLSADKVDTTQRTLWMYGGQEPASHTHADPLNLGYIAYDLDLLPEFGYPDTSQGDAHVIKKWSQSTMAHNTVSFTTKPGSSEAALYYTQFCGYSDWKEFADEDWVQVMRAGADRVFNGNTNYADMYDRTSALIRIDDASSYIVDLFRVDSAAAYQYNLHTASVNSTNTQYSNLTLAESSKANTDGVKNYKTATVSGDSFSVDWNLRDAQNRFGLGANHDTDVHMKVTMLGEYDGVEFAEGVTPKIGAVPMLMVSGSGKTTFAAVMEGYQGESNIASVEALSVQNENGSAADENVVRAIKVALKNGRVDYIVNSMDTSARYLVDGKFTFQGFYGVYSEQNGRYVNSCLVDGSQIGELTASLPEVTGTVAGSNYTLSSENYVDVSYNQPVEPAQLVGRILMIDNHATGSKSYNADYRILGAQKQSDGTVRLDIGDVSMVTSWKDTADYSKGYCFNFTNGDSFRIPLSAADGVVVPVTGISLDRTALTLKSSGATATLKATVVPDNATSKSVSWSSGNPAVASVDANGKVTAVSNGIAVITATAGGKTATCTVTVSIASSGGAAVSPQSPSIPDTVPVEEMVKEIETTKEPMVSFKTTKPVLADSNLFSAAKEHGKDLIFSVVDDAGELLYAWSFAANDIKLPQISASLELKVSDIAAAQADIRKITGGVKGQLIRYSHSGLLPGQAKVTLNVKGIYPDGTTLNYYYLNQATGRAEIAATELVVKDGKVQFPQYRCSEYLLTRETIPGAVWMAEARNAATPPVSLPVAGNPQTGDANPMLGWMVLLSAAAGILFVVALRKEKGGKKRL